MPTTPITREALPYVRPAYEPDTRTLRELMALAGQSRANAVGRKGQARAEGLMTLGQLISQGLAGIRQGREREQANAFAAAKEQQDLDLKRRDQQLREADLMARISEREATAAEREQARADRLQADAYKRGGEVAEEVGYGPMSEMQLDSVMQGPAAGRARYSFGPGTAEGPELQPTRQQQRGIETERQIQAMGGMIGPNGQVVMPPKPETVNLKVEDVLLDGRPAKVVFNPSTGKFQQNGVDVTGRVQPIPPASQSQPREQKFVIRNGQVVPVLAGQAQPGDIPYSAEAMQGMGGEAADVRSSRAAAALNSIDKLKTLAPVRSPGLPGMAEGAAASVAGALGYNTGVRQYNALLQPTAMQMAVAIQGAAGLSNSEREAMAKMLGDISTMDYESQMALLENASQMIRSGADVDFVSVKDAKTGQPVQQWVPKRSRMPGSVVVDVNSGIPSPQGGKVRMRAPDGSVQEVDAAMVEHYKGRGAKVVK